jgi:NADH-quinone oxidoreductase subunit H
MVSYEVAMGMSLVPVLLLAGTSTFAGLISAQQSGLWFVLPLGISFFVFLVAGFAETNRLPFDLPEAESELIAGYHTEYSAMKFSLFFIAEYANMVTVSAMAATLFFGGWDIPFTHWDEGGGALPALVTGLVMFAKTLFFLFSFMWVRWTLPRFRYDQLMSLGWKFMIPLALAYILLVGFAVWLLQGPLAIEGPVPRGLILLMLNLVLGYLVFFVLDRGHVLAGSYRVPGARPSALGTRP